MDKTSITAHMIVKNEDRFVWYAISSILPFVDKFLIYDTGSTDKTIEIISTITDKKIIFESKKIQTPEDIGKLRQEQIEKTKTDWFWVIDGDEVYPQSLCMEIIDILKIKGKELEGIVVGRCDLLGDVYHYQDESVGTYELFGKKGHIVLRLINIKNITGLHIEGIYPMEGYYDERGSQIINHNPRQFALTEGKLFHAMYLPRSGKGANLSDTFHREKWKIEWGKQIDQFKLPEVLSQPHPNIVPNVLDKRSNMYKAVAAILTPIKMLKRAVVK